MIKIKSEINKAQLFRELTKIGKRRFECTYDPEEDLEVFLLGAKELLKLLRKQ